MHSNVPWTPQQPKISKAVLIALSVLSALGFLDAAYLAAEHYAGAVPPCSLVAGCERVLTSEYAAVGGVPVALTGALFYAAAFLLLVAYSETKRAQLLTALFTLSGAAFLASAWFVYVQLFVIGALCLYCMASALISTLIFGLTAGIFFKVQD